MLRQGGLCHVLKYQDDHARTKYFEHSNPDIDSRADGRRGPLFHILTGLLRAGLSYS